MSQTLSDFMTWLQERQNEGKVSLAMVLLISDEVSKYLEEKNPNIPVKPLPITPTPKIAPANPTDKPDWLRRMEKDRSDE